jgi:hypothetical protein
VAGIQKEKPTDEQLAEAEKAVKQVNVVLEEGVAFVKMDHDYQVFANDTKGRVADLTERIAKRKIALAAAEARAALQELLNTAKAKIDASKKSSSTDADITAAQKAVDDIPKALEAKADLEKKDGGYAGFAERGRNEVIRLIEALEISKQARELRRMTGDALTAANTAVTTANGATDQKKKKELYEQALAKLKACQEDGGRAVRDNPSLARVEVLLDEQPSNAKAVMAACAEKSAGLQEPLKQTVAQIRFEDGPKKAYEAARYLLQQGRKPEALAQYNECVATGRIAENRHPEYKDKKRDVAGQSLTVLELVDLCDKERKPLQGK